MISGVILSRPRVSACTPFKSRYLSLFSLSYGVSFIGSLFFSLPFRFRFLFPFLNLPLIKKLGKPEEAIAELAAVLGMPLTNDAVISRAGPDASYYGEFLRAWASFWRDSESSPTSLEAGVGKWLVQDVTHRDSLRPLPGGGVTVVRGRSAVLQHWYEVLVRETGGVKGWVWMFDGVREWSGVGGSAKGEDGTKEFLVRWLCLWMSNRGDGGGLSVREVSVLHRVVLTQEGLLKESELFTSGWPTGTPNTPRLTEAKL